MTALAAADEEPRAKCAGADPEAFFPDASAEDEVARWAARTYCSGCPLSEACLEHAIASREFGVWAGTSTDERRRIARRRTRRPAATTTTTQEDPR